MGSGWASGLVKNRVQVMLTVIIKQISNLGQNNLIDFAYSEL